MIEEALQFLAAFLFAAEEFEDDLAPRGVIVAGIKIVDVLGDDAGEGSVRSRRDGGVTQGATW